ncbi:MAG: hypothetical protein KGM98_14820 [Bacteroidota bacterium]|nr:hypothetical protein [Bacteroidota bacterium]
MDPRKLKWLPNPTKKQLVVFSTVWVFGVLLILLASTNFFTESLFYKQNFVLFFLVLASSTVLIGIWKNFLARK